MTRANRRIYRILLEPLQPHHLRGLDKLLNVAPDSNLTWLVWLRQSPLRPNSRYVREHIERLKIFQSLALPDGLGRQIHQNRLLKMAREGAQMTPRDPADFEDERRYATLVALAIEGMATATDELVDLHDRIMVKLFSAAKNMHQQEFQKQGKAFNDKVRLYSRIGRALVAAKESGGDPYAAIETVLPWSEFEQSVTEAAQLAQPQTFDQLPLIGEQYGTLRRFTPEFLDVLKLKAAPTAQAVLDAIDVVREMNAAGSRKVPEDAPTSFIKARWKPLVFTGEGIDRRFYEICALSELKNALRSGDISVFGSRQFRDFEDYLLPPGKFSALQKALALPIAINPDLDQYLLEHVLLLNQQLSTVNRLALANELPDAIISATSLKITQQDPIVPKSAQALIDQSSNFLPCIKITELLMDVDDWTGFTRHFVHLKSGAQVQDRTLLLSAILADAINLGLTKMAESSPDANYSKLSWLQALYVRDETYSAGLADLVNAQFRHPFAVNWGDGSTSSSDGQRFRAGGRAESTGHINPKCGADPGEDGLHPYFGHVCAVQHQNGQRRHARFDLCARRAALPRVGFAHRGALHGHGRLH